MNELERLKAELERVQKQAAVMRRALVRLCNSWAEGTERENYEAMKEAKAAISSDAGRDFISREQVKPLVDGLEFLAGFNWENLTPSIPEKIHRAVDHARKLGL